MTLPADGVKWDDAPETPAVPVGTSASGTAAGAGVTWDDEKPAPAPKLQPPEKSRSWARAAGDLGIGLGEGTVSAGMFIPQLANTLTGGAVDKYAFKPLTSAIDAALGGPGEGNTLAQASQQTRGALDQFKSPQLRQQEQELADTKGFLPTVKKIVTSPTTLLPQYVAEQAAQLVAPGGLVKKAGAVAFERAAGSALARGIEKRVAAGMGEEAATKAAQGAAERLGKRAAIKAGTKAAIGTEALQSGSQNSEQAQQEVMGLDQSVLDADPAYKALVASGVSPQDAREQRAQSAGLRAGAASAAITAATGGLTGKLESKIFQGETGVEGLGKLFTRQGAKEIGKAVGKETAQEGLQEGGEQFGQNLGVQSVDPNKNLMDQVPESAALGSVIGGVLGGGMFAGSAALTHPHAQREASGPLGRAAEVVADSRAAAPGSLTDVAQSIGGLRPNETGAESAGVPRVPGAGDATPPASSANANEQPPAPAPAPAPRMEPQTPPWVNQQTGAISTPTKAELTTTLASHIADQYNQLGHMRVNTGDLADAWGVPVKDINKARNAATQIATRIVKGQAENGVAPSGTPSPEADTGTTASVPFMITQAMRTELRGLGHTDADIRTMTPEQAHDTLKAAEPVLGKSRDLMPHDQPAADEAVKQAQADATTSADAATQSSTDATQTGTDATPKETANADGSTENPAPTEAQGAGAKAQGAADEQLPAVTGRDAGTGDAAAQPEASHGPDVSGAVQPASADAALTETQPAPAAKDANAEPTPVAEPAKPADQAPPESARQEAANPVPESQGRPTEGVVAQAPEEAAGAQGAETPAPAEPVAAKPFKATGAARAAEGLRVKTPEGETNGRSHVDNLIKAGYTKVQSTQAGDKMVHSLVNADGEHQSIKARQLPYAKEASDRATVQATEVAAHAAAPSPHNDLPEPTPGQIEAGNYQKGHIKVHGLDVSIENPQGSTRRGTGEGGKPWEHVMGHHYGYVRGSVGADGEHVDAYVGPHHDAKRVFVVDQIDQKTGAFDEHKVMLGFKTQADAIKAYRSNFDKGWKVGRTTGLSTEDFKSWLKEGDTKAPLKPVKAEVAPVKEATNHPETSNSSIGATEDTKAAFRSEVTQRRRDVVQVAQPTPVGSTVVETKTLSGLKKVKAKLYELPNYDGPQLAVASYKSTRGEGYRVYLPKTGVMLEDSNGVRSLADTVRAAADRVKTARQRIEDENRKETTGRATTKESVASKSAAPNHVNTAIEQIASGEHPGSVLLHADESTVRAVGKALKYKFSATEPVGALMMRMNATAPSDLRKWAAEAGAHPDTVSPVGKITEVHAKAAGVASGNIVLTKAGEDHINRPARLKQLKAAGYADARALVKDVAGHFNAIYRGRGDSLLLAIKKPGEKVPLLYVELKPSGEGYEVNSGFVSRPSYLKNDRLLWEGAPTPHSDGAPSAVSGQGNQSRQESTTGKATSDEGSGAAADRRTQQDQRDAIDALPPEQSETEKLRARVADLERERSTSDVTGLRNKRAFDDDATLGWKAVGAADMDGLKLLNDSIGHEAADSVLKLLGDHLRSLESDAVRFYHRSGDEFAARFKNAEDAEPTLRAAQDALDKVQVQFTVDGKPLVYDGIGLSVGHGETYEQADTGVNADKVARLASGKRQSPRESGAPGRLRDATAQGQGEQRGAERGSAVPEAGQGEVGNPPDTTDSSKAQPASNTIEHEETSQGNVRLFSRDDGTEHQPFYSALTRSVDTAKGAPKAADGAAWKQWMDGAQRRGEFKATEREWLGVDQWLDSQKGKVSREDLQQFVRENQVQIKDVTLDGGKEAKFSEYTMPGGENYKELLLTLPKDQAPHILTHRGEMVSTHPNKDAAVAAMREAQEHAARTGNRRSSYNVKPEHITGDFNSNHFDQPNILAHVRFNERTDADGKKVLFLEEVQSDWHQAGRKKGYAGTYPDTSGWTVARDPRGEAVDVRDSAGNFVSRLDESLTGKLDDAAAIHRAAGEVSRVGVPDAPFKSTPQWSMLAFKRMVAYAAEHGFDRIAWTQGEDQAARYDLSKQVDGVRVMPSSKPDQVHVMVQHKGSKDFVRIGETSGVEKSKLADAIGKDLAEKALAKLDADGQSAEFHGVDLKVGGEGMKAFYDKLLPNEVNKWAKPFEARVGETQLPTGEHSLKGEDIAPDSFDAHSIDITPTMYEAAMGGLPMFRYGVEDAGAEADAGAKGGVEQAAHTAKVQAAVDDLTSSWKGDDLPKVEVVATPEDLPNTAKFDPNTGKPDIRYKTASGFYDGKTIWIVASKHEDTATGRAKIVSTLTHEAVGHYGIERIVTRELGDKAWSKIEQSIERLRNDTSLGSKAMRAVLDSVERRYRASDGTPADRKTYAREVLAVMAERGVRNGILDRAMTALRRFVRKLFPKHFEAMHLNERELRQLLVKSDEYLQHGQTYAQRVQSRAAMAFSKNEKTSEADVYRDNLAKAMKSSGDLDKALPIGRASEALKAAGLADLPLVIKKDTVLKATRGERQPEMQGKGNVHDVRMADIQNLPELLDRPVMVLHSRTQPNSVVAITDARDLSGRPVVVALHADVRSGVTEVHRVASLYGKDGVAGFVRDDLKGGRLLYRDSQKSPAWLKSVGLQLPGDRAVRDSWDSVPTQRADVKPETTPGPSLFSRDENDRGEKNEPGKPRAPFSDAAASMETMDAARGDEQRTAWQQAKDWIAGKVQDMKPGALGWLHLRHIVELAQSVPAIAKGATQYRDTEQAMEGYRQRLENEGGATVKKVQQWAFEHGPAGWMGSIKPEAHRMFQFMARVTQLQVDPTTQYEKLLMSTGGGEMLPWTKDLIKARIKVLREVMLGRSGDDKKAMMDQIKDLQGLPKREKVRETQHPNLVREWNTFSPEAQEAFASMRDYYRDYSEKMLEAHIGMVNASTTLPEGNKRAQITQMRDAFAQSQVGGVYFPLGRFGDFWISGHTQDVMNESGEVTAAGKYFHERYENAAAQERAERRIKAAGGTVEASGRADGNYQASKAPKGTFVSEIIGVLKASGASDKALDEVYQTYLKTMPELAMSKHGIHRKNVAGYTDDVVRVFAHNVQHGSIQLARATYGYQLNNALEHIEGALDAMRYGGNTPATHKEFRAFMEAVISRTKRNREGELALAERDAAAGKPGNISAEEIQKFVNHRMAAAMRDAGAEKKSRREILGKWEALPDEVKEHYADQVKSLFGGNATPAEGNSVREVAHAEALVNELGQRNEWIMNPTDSKWSSVLNGLSYLYYLGASPASAIVNMIQVPQIVFPFLGARHGWSRAAIGLSKAMGQAIRTRGNMHQVLTGEDLKAYKALQETGIFQRTQTHMLAGLAAGNRLKSSPAWTNVMNWMSYMFQTAEVINREATGMAAFRLARGDGKSFMQAIQYAGDATNGTHGDYSNSNRSRHMQGNVAKVALQFKSYGVAMGYLWGRESYLAFKGGSAEERTLARKTVLGMMGMTGLFAGTLGLPMINALKYTMQAMHAAFGDDDTPWDFDTEFRNWLAEWFGDTAASMIADGVVNKLGANVSSRVGMSDLLFRDDDRPRTNSEAVQNMFASLMGPTGGVIVNLARGSDQIGQGHISRGIETMLPTFAKNAMKSVRYASEGVNTLKGAPIVDDVSGPAVFAQLIGFRPTSVAEQQRKNNVAYNTNQFVQDRRGSLMNAYAMALQHGDGDDRAAVMRKIGAFNRKWPQWPIGMSNLRASIRGRAQALAQAQHGVRINKRIATQIQQRANAQEE